MNNVDAKWHRRSAKGLSRVAYFHQEQASIVRKYSAPPNYTLSEFREWMFSQPNFNELYYAWIESGYQKSLKPSADRLNDYKPYTLKNLRLVTWEENNRKGALDRRNGINNKKSLTTRQYDLNGKFLKEYYSMKQASRETGITYRGIAFACCGERKTSGGFIWRLLK